MKINLPFSFGRRTGYVSVGTPPCSSSDGEPRDNGNQPYAFNSKRLAEANTSRRTALWTGKHLQLTHSRLAAGEDYKPEKYEHLDRMITVTSGYGEVESESPVDGGTHRFSVSEGYSVIIPAGALHTVRNTGTLPLCFYSVYTHPVSGYGEVIK